VLDLVLLRVRLRARRRASWLDQLSERVSGEGAVRLRAALDDRDNPLAEAEWHSRSEAVARDNQALEHVEGLLAGDAGERLRRLESLLSLSQAESDLLQTCLALAVGPDLEPLFAYLQRHDGRGCVTDSLAARLFGYGRRAIWAADLPIAIWGLVTPSETPVTEGTPLFCDRQVIRWFQGSLGVDPSLVGALREVERHEPPAGWPVEKTVQLFRRSLEREGGARILLEGPVGCGRKTFAAAVAARFGIATLAVDTGRISDEDWNDSFMRVQRLGILGGMALLWYGHGVARRWPAEIVPAPLQFVACEETEVVPPHGDLVDYRVVLPTPTLEERRALWAKLVPESAAWPAREREGLISRHRLAVGQVVAVGRRRPASPQEASQLCREMTRAGLGELGRLLDCPFSWDDLVVPRRLREALEDFAFEARDRAIFWESPAVRRLFPRGTGLIGLFTGPPGTGKTMAAQVIAAELELDLFRIDLATVVSKYIGETSKNLSKIFARAARMSAVLLFDEADALFSRRTEVRDAHDRYANTDTNYLLQLLEEYRGIALLATNKKSNIDPAFTRRVRYVLDFPRPDDDHRRRMWHGVIAAMTDVDTVRSLHGAIEALAGSVEATGAQIKNAVLAAVFMARRSRGRLGIEQLVRGLERELEKEGRSLGPLERERVMRHA
jgi:AAA+ superfamily predicted ATPase